jgi:hypothetical protein
MEVPNTRENLSKCFCGDCEIWSEFSLSGEGYYCINGKAS